MPAKTAMVILALVCSTTFAQEISFSKVKNTSGWSDNEPGCQVIRTQQELRRLAERHGAPTVPASGAIYFDDSQYMLVGVFLGRRPSAGYGMALRSVAQEQGRIVVVYQESLPTPGELQARALVSLYEFIQIPRSPLPVECRALNPVQG